MPTQDKHFVAIIGGFWKIEPHMIGPARDTAKMLGAELAKAGFGLVVYFSNDESLEPHVVSGYVAAQKSGKALIRVRYAESQDGTVLFPEQASRSELFEPVIFPGQDWEAPFYRSLVEEDRVNAVLLVAGATSTLIAGHIAVARRLPTLAWDQFGGSARVIWRQLAQRASGDYPSAASHSAKDLIAKLKTECEEAAQRRDATKERDRFYSAVTSQRNQALYAGGAFVILAAALSVGLSCNSAQFYPFIMLAGLISGGATGALVRLVLWGPRENDARISLLLGGVAGFAVGLAYLIPQWLGAPSLWDASATGISSTQKIQLACAILSALPAGIGFDTVLSRLQKQAPTLAVQPPAAKKPAHATAGTSAD